MPEMPEMPKGPQKPKAGRSFDDLLKELKPQLDKLPPEQKIPALPPDKLALESVQEFVTANGMVVPDSCPPTIAVAGEFLDRSQLREGRVGMLDKIRVVSFLYRYADKSLRAVVIFPREGVDARSLGKAIFWGQVADVPETVAQSRIMEVKDFFAINSFDLSKIIDVPALERFKSDCQKTADAEVKTAQERSLSAQKRISTLEAEKEELELQNKKLALKNEEARKAEIDHHNRAEAWKLSAVVASAVVFLTVLRWLF